MFDAALRLGVAAALAIAFGLAARAALVGVLPGTGLFALLARASLLCALGLSVYAGAARLLGVREIVEIERTILRKLRLRRRAGPNLGETT